MDLGDPVDPEVVGMHLPDHLQPRRVGQRPRRGQASLGGVVGARGDLQVLADRLDPELVLVVVDELHDHRCGRSSSAAKQADADLKIGVRAAQLTVLPLQLDQALGVTGRGPEPVPGVDLSLADPTRNVSGLIPSCSPTRCNAPGRVTGSRRASTAIRTARSRSSSGYFLGAAMTLILSGIESLHQTRHETSGWSSRAQERRRDTHYPRC